jgi:hypothetical protein
MWYPLPPLQKYFGKWLRCQYWCLHQRVRSAQKTSNWLQRQNVYFRSCTPHHTISDLIGCITIKIKFFRNYQKGYRSNLLIKNEKNRSPNMWSNRLESLRLKILKIPNLLPQSLILLRWHSRQIKILPIKTHRRLNHRWWSQLDQ